MAIGDALDTSQQPITAADPRVAQILALIRAKAGSSPPPETSTAPLDAPIPQQPMPAVPTSLGGPTLAQQANPQPGPPPPDIQNIAQMGGNQPPQLPPTPPPNVTQAPGPGPVKSFLQQLVSGLGSSAYAGTQGAMQRLGLPTDYEKQQNALKMGIAQQGANDTSAYRQAQTGLTASKANQFDTQNAPYSIDAEDKSVLPQFRGSSTTFGGYQALQKLSGGVQGKEDVQSAKDAALLARAQALVKNGGTSFQHVAGTTAGQNTFANYNPKTGEYTDLSGKVLTDFKPASKAMQGALGGFGPAFAATRTLMAAYNENPALLPVLAPMLSKMLAPGDPNAQQIFASLPNGQPQDATGNPIGLRMPGAPTGATRSRGQFAQAVIPSVERAKTEVANLGAQLGPMSGRLNDLYTGTIGAYGPQFSGLQTELKNVGTAWMRLHANSETARADFAKMLASSNDPANLVANLNALEGQAKDYVTEAQGRPSQLGGSTPAVQALTDGGTTYHIPTALVSAFKKDHPNAR